MQEWAAQDAARQQNLAVVWADMDASTPLHWAALNNQPESARLLLEAGANPELPDREACTLLYWAVECQARELEQLLRDHGATRMEFSAADRENI